MIRRSFFWLLVQYNTYYLHMIQTLPVLSHSTYIHTQVKTGGAMDEDSLVMYLCYWVPRYIPSTMH